MSVIYILIPIAILLTALGIYLFFWAVKTEQFDDLEKQGLSILFDDDTPKSSNKDQTKTSDNEEQVTADEIQTASLKKQSASAVAKTLNTSTDTDTESGPQNKHDH